MGEGKGGRQYNGGEDGGGAGPAGQTDLRLQTGTFQAGPCTQQNRRDRGGLSSGRVGPEPRGEGSGSRLWQWFPKSTHGID